MSGHHVVDEIILKSNKKARKSPYLTSELLLSNDGLQKIYAEFPSTCKFRGKGYENDDLKKMLWLYKEWAFMLNPGSAFPDLLNKCESLGNTNEVKTLMLHMRQKERERFIIHKKAFPFKPKKRVKFEL
jgi:hypothetical protein